MSTSTSFLLGLLLVAAVAAAVAAAAPVPPRFGGRASFLQRSAEALSTTARPVAAPSQQSTGGAVGIHGSFAAGVNESFVSVSAYGAVGDGKTDNTKAFQDALNALMPAGGVVWVPAGQYIFEGNLNVPAAVTLEGTYRSVPSHPVGQHGLAPVTGSVLMPRGGRNNASGTAFITLQDDATLRGVLVYYPGQDPNAAPVPYPYAVRLGGENAAVIDVELLNPFNGIYAVAAPRHYIARVQGQPANVGVYVDQTYDIGRIDNVHFNPWFSDNKAYMAYQLTHGRAFVFARTDWEYVLNCFAFGYSVGYHFIKSPQGSCNGNFLGIGADMAANASVLVEAADPWGIMITNGEFTSFNSWTPEVADSTQVVVESTDVNGAVRFVNSAFWGPSNNVARINAQATVSFSQCTFSAWDADKQNRAAINATAGNILVQGCDFQMDGNQVSLGPGVAKAVVLGNIITGTERIINNGAKNVQKGYNAADA